MWGAAGIATSNAVQARRVLARRRVRRTLDFAAALLGFSRPARCRTRMTATARCEDRRVLEPSEPSRPLRSRAETLLTTGLRLPIAPP